MSSKMENKVIGNQYRLIRALDAGGMGTVFMAEHLLTGQVLAIKMLRPELTNDPEVRDRFLSEAQTLAGLEHQHIVQWKNSFEEDSGYFLVMQFVEGTNVGARIEEEGYLSIEESIPIALQTLAGLDYIHRKGVVHRDLKPANLLLTKEREIKLADFGIARIVGTSRKTQPGMAIGTYVYMSPEQLLGKNADHRTDIYSLGITLYEMLTGELPFQGDTTYEVCRQHLEEPLPSLLEKRPDLPPSLEALLIRATEKDPAKRFQSAKEFISALTQAFPEYAWKSLKPLGLDTNRNLISALQGHQSEQREKEQVVTKEASPRGLGFYMMMAFVLGTIGLTVYTFFPEKPLTLIKPPVRNSILSVPYNDTFANNRAGWPQGEQFSAMMTLSPKNYRVATLKGNSLSTLCPHRLQAVQDNIVLETKAEVLKADAKGKGIYGLTLYFDRKQGSSQGIYVGVNPPKQQFTVSSLKEKKWSRLVNWKDFTGLKKEGSNLLRVTVQSKQLQLEINGKVAVKGIALPNLLDGQSCLFVQQGGAIVQFQRFGVRPLVIDATKP